MKKYAFCNPQESITRGETKSSAHTNRQITKRRDAYETNHSCGTAFDADPAGTRR